jgi:hypothetical protein
MKEINYWHHERRCKIISGSVEAYIVDNFRAHEISRGTCKLTLTPILIQKKIDVKLPLCAGVVCLFCP